MPKRDIEEQRGVVVAAPTNVCVCFVLISFCSHSLCKRGGWYLRRISTLLFALDERKCNPAVLPLPTEACYLKRLLRGSNSRMRAADVYGTPTRAQTVKGNFVVCTRASGGIGLLSSLSLISFFRIPTEWKSACAPHIYI